METYATTKGQIVIPSQIRKKLGIENGTRILIDIDADGHRIILTPITRQYVQVLQGKYGNKNLFKTFLADRDSVTNNGGFE